MWRRSLKAFSVWTIAPWSGRTFASNRSQKSNGRAREARGHSHRSKWPACIISRRVWTGAASASPSSNLEAARSEEHTSELQSLAYLVCRLLLEKKKKQTDTALT